MPNVSDYLTVNSPNVINQARANHITPEQMLQIMQQPGYLGTPSSGLPAGHFMGGSSVSSDTSDPGPAQQQSQTTNTLRLLNTLGLTGGNNNQQQGPQMVDPTASMQTMNAMSNLGRAALGQDYTIINPTPGQGNMSEGGVNPVQQASLAKGWAVPSQYTNTPGVFSAAQRVAPTGGTAIPSLKEMQQYFYNQAGADRMGSIKAEEVPADTAQTYWNAMHPQTAPKSGFTPTTPATSAAFSATPAPFAQAPAAPGGTSQPAAMPNQLQMGALGQPGGQPPAAPAAGGSPSIIDWHAMAAHTSGLENAGKALFAHFGGDPGKATPEQIAGFHQELQGALAGGPPIKMRSGGLVPGHGNTDSVPALLTPGEYVIPKQQVAQLFGGRAPLRMEGGGLVPDDQDDSDKKKKPAPEVRRAHLTPPGSPPPAPSQGDATPSSSQSSQQSSAAATTPSGNQGYWSNLVNQAQAQRALNSVGASAANNYADIGGTGYGSPMAIESPMGQSPSMAGALGPSTASTAAGVADVAGGLIQGLADAAKKYADSIKDWHWQQKAFGQGGTPNYQTVNLQQDQEV